MTPLQVLDRYLEALLDGDLDAIRASFAEDAVWTLHGDLPIAGPWHGRDAIVDDFLVKVGGELFEPGTPTFDWLSRTSDDHAAVLEWRVRARTTGGLDYDNRYLGVFEVSDDRITQVREYTDTGYMSEVLFADQGRGHRRSS
jgi:ketosteroid isomerase-like protein